MKFIFRTSKKLLFIVMISSSLHSQINNFFTPENHATIVDSLNNLENQDPNLALRLAFKVLDKYPIETKDRTILKVYNVIGQIFLKKGLSIQALQYFMEVERESIRINNGSYWNLINIGNVYYQEKKWIKAEEYFIRAYEDVTKRIRHDGNEKRNVMAVSLMNRAMIFKDLKEYEKSYKLMIQALEIRKKPFSRLSDKSLGYSSKFISNEKNFHYGNISFCYLNLMDLYIKWDMLGYASSYGDTCSKYLEKFSEQNFETTGIYYKKYKGLLFQKRGTISALKNKFNESMSLYEKANSEFEKWPNYKAHNYYLIANFLKERNNLYGALENLDKGLLLCKINNLSIQELELLQAKSDIFKELNIAKSALEVEELIKNKIISNNKSRIDDNLESMEMRGQLYSSRYLLSNAKGKINILILFTGVSFILLGFIILYFRNKKKQVEKLAKVLKKEESLSKELLLSKENELVQMSTFIVSKNEIIQSINKDLNYHINLIKSDSEKRSFNPLINKLKDEINLTGDWHMFQKNFANIYPNFISYLSSYNSELSTNDIKVCCYLKMNQTTKDIAQLTGLSVRAIENRRYRLRKKLNLDKKTNLVTFLININN